jgi:two-component system, NtrC family, response regulator AtoC
MAIEKILLLEDEAVVRRNLEQQLRSRRYEVASCQTLADARTYLSKDSFDLVIADVRLPDGEGTDLLRQLQARAQKPPVVMISGVGTVETAVECMRAGAFDYLLKPFSAQQIEITLKKAEEFTQLIKVNQFLARNHDDAESHELLGKGPAIDRLRALIRRVARTEASVLIQGESGTGKELVARAIYEQSSRADAPFIAVNCAAVPENLIESEFFGHEKGAFTGALNKREGRFELAHGGTIFLDEISEISPQVQAKLLRVLQERELTRVGGDRVIKVNVRIIATTNRRLQESIERKEFREDLYFRLNVVPIYMPALREHMEDVPLLAKHFLQRFARKHGVDVTRISDGCLDALLCHKWPGNVRELQNVIERAVILCADGDTLREEHLGFGHEAQLGQAIPPAISVVRSPSVMEGAEPSVLNRINSSRIPTATAGDRQENNFTDFDSAPKIPSLWEMERQLIFAALRRCHDNRTHAAKMIGISLRTLRNKLAEYRSVGFASATHGTDKEETAEVAAV